MNNLSDWVAIIICLLILFAVQVANAARINNVMLNEGDSVGKVIQSLGEPDYFTGNSILLAADKLYYRDNHGGIYELTIDNGTVANIDFNRE